MNFNPELVERYKKLDTLPNIAERLGIDIKQMNRWAERNRKLDFPQPIKRLGKYRLYDADKVEEWVILWLKINKNLGNDNLVPGGKTKGRDDG